MAARSGRSGGAPLWAVRPHWCSLAAHGRPRGRRTCNLGAPPGRRGPYRQAPLAEQVATGRYRGGSRSTRCGGSSPRPGLGRRTATRRRTLNPAFDSNPTEEAILRGFTPPGRSGRPRRQKNPGKSVTCNAGGGGYGWDRTTDLTIMSRALSPAELRSPRGGEPYPKARRRRNRRGFPARDDGRAPASTSLPDGYEACSDGFPIRGDGRAP